MFVDNAAMRIIQWPKDFDVMVTENMFGDILTDAGQCDYRLAWIIAVGFHWYSYFGV